MTDYSDKDYPSRPRPGPRTAIVLKDNQGPRTKAKDNITGTVLLVIKHYERCISYFLYEHGRSFDPRLDSLRDPLPTG